MCNYKSVSLSQVIRPQLIEPDNKVRLISTSFCFHFKLPLIFFSP